MVGVLGLDVPSAIHMQRTRRTYCLCRFLYIEIHEVYTMHPTLLQFPHVDNVFFRRWDDKATVLAFH